jgi:hypothetical protein
MDNNHEILEEVAEEKQAEDERSFNYKKKSIHHFKR